MSKASPKAELPKPAKLQGGATVPAELPLQQVPSENVEILKDGLGLDITKRGLDTLKQAVSVIIRSSSSSSPYTSAEMLEEYVERGFPDLPGKIISAIDAQTAHRQNLEDFTTKRSERREDLAQIGAWVIGIAGVLGALIGGYLHVPTSICIAVVILCIGGPNAATIVSRILDRLP